MQVTRTTAGGFGFSLSPCAPPCRSTGCSDSLIEQKIIYIIYSHGSSLSSAVLAEHIPGCSCATGKEEGQPASASAAGQQQRVTSGDGQSWAVPSFPGPAGQEPQPRPSGTKNTWPIICRLSPEGCENGQPWMGVWSLPAPKNKAVCDQVFPQHTRE